MPPARLGPRERAAASGGAREPRDGERHDDGAEDERDRDGEPRLRHEQRRRQRGRSAHGEGGERRRDDAHEQVLERVDVGDEAAQQLARPRPRQAARDERLEPAEEVDADAREEAERRVVGDEPLEVAERRAGEREEADADDHDGQREDLRPEGGARDQVAGRRHQPGARGERERREQEREGEPPPQRAGEREDAEQRPHP